MLLPYFSLPVYARVSSGRLEPAPAPGKAVCVVIPTGIPLSALRDVYVSIYGIGLY